MPNPTKFDESMIETARRLALLGLTDEEIGFVLGVSDRTLRRWKRAHPEFAAALESGKRPADGAVAAALFRRAVGFQDHSGRTYPPDPVACIFWLKNRAPELWRDRVDVAATHKVAEADWARLDQAHDRALQKAEAQRALYADRAQRLGLTLEHEDGALSEIEDAETLPDDG